MTAKDVTIARALVDVLDAVSFSNDATVSYSHEADRDLAEVSSAEVWVGATLRHRRIARDKWASDVVASVVAVAPQGQSGASGDTDTETEKDNWLAFVDDELVTTIKAEKVDGSRPMEIEFRQRMDAGKLRAMSIFYTHFQITYPLV